MVHKLHQRYILKVNTRDINSNQRYILKVNTRDINPISKSAFSFGHIVKTPDNVT